MRRTIILPKVVMDSAIGDRFSSVNASCAAQTLQIQLTFKDPTALNPARIEYTDIPEPRVFYWDDYSDPNTGIQSNIDIPLLTSWVNLNPQWQRYCRYYLLDWDRLKKFSGTVFIPTEAIESD